MALSLNYAPGQTPLDADELDQLIPKHITTQGELNEWEQVNIQSALTWALRPVRAKTPTLTEDFCRELHRRMFDKTWKWAGTFRKSDKNIGCDWRQVPMRLNQLLANTQHQLDHGVDLHKIAFVQLRLRVFHDSNRVPGRGGVDPALAFGEPELVVVLSGVFAFLSLGERRHVSEYLHMFPWVRRTTLQLV